MSNLETFRMRLEQLKQQGADIDPSKVTEEIVDSHLQLVKDMGKEEREQKLFDLTLAKIVDLVTDFKEHYRPKGRKLKVIIRIEKDNSADAYGEKFVYDDDMQVINMIEIGTKGKYEKAIEER
jgi:hypothetical protein